MILPKVHFVSLMHPTATATAAGDGDESAEQASVESQPQRAAAGLIRQQCVGAHRRQQDRNEDRIQGCGEGPGRQSGKGGLERANDRARGQAEAEANATRMVSEAIAKGDTRAINYFIAQKYVEALGQIASAPNEKLVLMPLEAGNVIGALGGISDLLKGTKS